MQLQLQIAWGGVAFHAEALILGIDLERDLATRQYGLQFVDRMRAQAARDERAGHRGGQRIIYRFQQVATIDVELHADAVALQVGGFEIELEAVGEGDLADAEQGLGDVGDDGAGGAEIGIGEIGEFAAGGLLDGERGTAVPGFAQRFCAALGRGAAFEADERIFERHDIFLQRGHHRIGRDGGFDCGEPFERALRGGGDLPVIQQGQRAGDEGGIAARVLARSVAFDGGAQIGDLFGHLGLGKAVFERLPVDALRGGECAGPFAIACIDHEIGGATDLEDLRSAQPRAAEGWVVGSGEAQQATVDYGIADLAQHALAAAGERVGRGDEGPEAGDFYPLGQCWIDVDVGLAFEAVIDGAEVGRGRGLLGLPVGKMVSDRGFYHVRVEIADDDDGGVVRLVVALPERAQAIGGRAPQCIDGADRQAVGEAGVGEEKGEFVQRICVIVGVAYAAFGQHDALLALDSFRGKSQLAGGLAHQHQRGVEQVGIGARQVEFVDRLVEAGGGVGVRAEGQPLALEQAHHLALGHISRAIEGHMLDEMRIAALIVGLRDRAGADPQVHLGLARGRAVGADDIAHAVVERAEAVLRIDRQVGCGERPVGRLRWRVLRGKGQGERAQERGKQQAEGHGRAS